MQVPIIHASTPEELDACQAAMDREIDRTSRRIVIRLTELNCLDCLFNSVAMSEAQDADAEWNAHLCDD